MKNRKYLFILSTLFVCLITSCSYSSKKYAFEEEPEAYFEGQQDAIIQIRDAANYEYETYVNIDIISELLIKQYGEFGEEIRDATIYHPDIELYSTSDIVDSVIDTCVFDYWR